MQADRSSLRRSTFTAAILLLLAACATPNREAVPARNDEHKAAAEAKAEPIQPAATSPGPASSKQTANPQPAKIETLAQLADWEGKRPGISGQAENLWDIPLFQRLFEKTVGKKYATEIVRGWDGPSQTRIVRQDDSLIFQASKNHDAGNNNAYVFISLKTNVLGVCLHKAGAAKSSRDLWMETGKKPKTLPADACAKYEQLFRR